MTNVTRVRLLIAYGLAVAALVDCPPVGAQGDKKERSVKIDFKTADGVTLVGRYYAAMGAKKRGTPPAVVLLLHDFNVRKGGSSKAVGYQDLAATLQDDGYAVVSFDFRGFGDSTAVDDRFWDFPHNKMSLKGAAKKPRPSSINHSQFPARYYQNLVSDVAAARAYLERRNDARDINVANIIVVGVGEGATVGSAWVYNECRRRQDKSGIKIPTLLPRATMADPESKDIAAAVWVSLSPSLANQGQASNLSRWSYEAVRNQKIPAIFINGGGKTDSASRAAVKALLGRVMPAGVRKPPKGKPKKDAASEPKGDVFEHTKQIILKDDNLAGEKLLDKQVALGIQKRLGFVMEDRGSKEWTERDTAKARFLYTYPGKDQVVPGKVAKPHNQDAPLVDLGTVFSR